MNTKHIVFEVIYDKSKSIINAYLSKMSVIHNEPIEDIIKEFNEYTMNCSVIGSE